ncbi:MBL fold metallo-hydrolase [Arthrobacter sp. UM1]|uniref:MBL fold metallo-hydrolase n=1 Tax=Arthrobacter sp. UM1 TaxID=2766776 RepID=UPI001CF713B3|nr:MBL fold metallo-hydrolase [Arthrobacter sp. UM1]MCB4207210.1 MBL fold metallo-hydrolase [Arthrobacter sp. UM1]
MSTLTLTKHAHALVTLERDGAKAVVDPGNFASDAELDEAFAGATLLLITHVHPDHVDVSRVVERLAARPGLPVLAPQPVLDALEEAGADPAAFTEATGEGRRELGGFGIREHGGQHALIHLLIPLERNVGYLIDGAVFHPGDALSIPPFAQEARIPVLLAPTFTPWARLQEVMDFIAAVNAERALPIHDGPLTGPGSEFATGVVDKVASRYATRLEHWVPGDTRTVESGRGQRSSNSPA